MIFPVFDSVRDQLVSDDNPAREEGDLDFERCAALHNAIVKHGWTASGHSLDDLPLTTCWGANAEKWEEDADRLHPSMIEFLKRAYDTELPDSDYRFFYYLYGIIGPQGHESFTISDELGDFPSHYMTLYTPNDDLGSHAQGLMYDISPSFCTDD
jgi:hypothetical protein